MNTKFRTALLQRKTFALVASLFAATLIAVPCQGQMTDPDCVSAYQLYKENKFPESLERFKKILEKKPQSADAHLGYGKNELFRDNYESAIKHIELAISLNPRNALAHEAKGDYFDELKQYDKALDAYQTAIQLDPKEPEYLVDYGLTLIRMKRYKEADEYFDKALLVNPNCALAYYGKGYLLQVRDRNLDAIPLLKKAQALDPKEHLAPLVLSYVYTELGDYAEAKKQIDSAMKLFPDNPVHFNSRAEIYQEQGDLELALKDIQKAIELRPKKPLYRQNLGSILQDLGRFREALAAYDKAVEVGEEKDSNSFAWRAHFKESIKQYESALADCDKAIALDPKNGFAWSVRSDVQEELDNLPGALADINKAIELDPNDGSHYRDRTWILIRLKEFAKAIPDCDKAISLLQDKRQARAFADRAVCLFELGRFEEALSDINRAIEDSPRHIGAYYRKAKILACLKRYSEAEQCLNEAIDNQYSKAEKNLKQKQNTSLTKGQQWGLACSAILFMHNQRDFSTLAGQPLTGESTAQAKVFLSSNGWAISDREKFLRQYDRLLREGFREDYEAQKCAIENLRKEELIEYKQKLAKEQSTVQLDRLKVVEEVKDELKPLGILGFDLSRAVNICRMSYAADIIEEDEAWARILYVSQLIQKRYPSWNEFGKNYLYGRRYWSKKETENTGKDFELVYDCLTNFPNSIYKQCPWDTPLRQEFNDAVQRCIDNGNARNIPDMIAASDLCKPFPTEKVKEYVENPSNFSEGLGKWLLSPEPVFVHHYVVVKRKSDTAIENLFALSGINYNDASRLIAKAYYRRETGLDVDYEKLAQEAIQRKKEAFVDSDELEKKVEAVKRNIQVFRNSLRWQLTDKPTPVPRLTWSSPKSKTVLNKSASFADKVFFLGTFDASPAEPQWINDPVRTAVPPVVNDPRFIIGTGLVSASSENKALSKLFLYDRRAKTFQPVNVGTIDSVIDFCKIGDNLYILGTDQKQNSLVELNPQSKQWKSVMPPNKSGIKSIGSADGRRLICISESKLYEFTNNGWNRILQLPKNSDFDGVVGFNQTFYFPNSNDGSVSKLDRKNRSQYQDVADLSPPEMQLLRIKVKPWIEYMDNSLWVCAGSLPPSLLKFGNASAPMIAMYKGQFDFDITELFSLAHGSNLHYPCAITKDGEDLVLVTVGSIYRISKGTATKVVDFDTRHFRTAIVGSQAKSGGTVLDIRVVRSVDVIDADCYLLGTHRGPVLVTKLMDGSFKFEPISDSDEPVKL